MKTRILTAVLTICVLFVIGGESRACYIPPPPPPTLSSPADGYCAGGTTVTLAWNSAYGATSYYVYYGQSSGPTSPGTSAGCCSLQVNGLSSNTKYYWRVRACNSYGCSDYSSQRYFYTTTQPSQATNPSPGSPSSGISLNAVLSWTAGSGATSHDVYFGTNPTPGALEFKGNQPNTTYDPPGTLSSGTTYYWRIDEKNNCTTQGATWQFTTCSVPGKASLNSPLNGSNPMMMTLTLSWTAGSGATSHDVYFGTNETPGASEFKGNQSGTSYTTGCLKEGETYYWCIDEKNSCGTTTGDVWSFTSNPNGYTNLTKKKATPGGDPVTLHSGEHALSATDLQIMGRAMGVVMSRRHRGQAFAACREDSPFGYGWDMSYHMRVEQGDGL